MTASASAPAALSPAASAALDCAPRAALETCHAALAEIAAGARRYPPSVAPFAAADPADPGALARLARPGEVVAFLQATRPETPPGFEELQRAEGVQMLAGAETLRLAAGVDGTGVTALTPADAAEMLTLAEAARPGPFTLRALSLGRFWGLREGGRLVAMAGERFALPGFVEISGVCVAEEARGRGLARRLSLHAAARIAARGERPFLHAFAANRPALALYDSLGFETRAAMQVGVFRRDPG